MRGAPTVGRLLSIARRTHLSARGCGTVPHKSSGGRFEPCSVTSVPLASVFGAWLKTGRALSTLAETGLAEASLAVTRLSEGSDQESTQELAADPVATESSQLFDELWQSRRKQSGVLSNDEPPLEEQHTLQTAILGCPNAGKSTLTNRLVGLKVSAVSAKTNTTNTPSFGTYTEGVNQLILHDTPGVVDNRHLRGPKHTSRVLTAFSIARECDLVLLLIDAHRQVMQPDPRVKRLVSDLNEADRLGSSSPPVVLLLNKVDKFELEDLEHLTLLERDLRSQVDFCQTFRISAVRGDGIQELKEYLLSQASLAHWILDPDAKSAKSAADIIAEVVREKLFRRLHKELPYRLDIKLTQSDILRDGSSLYHFTIICPSEAARRIIVGKKGCVIGEVGITARRELQSMLKIKLHLYLKVAVRQ